MLQVVLLTIIPELTQNEFDSLIRLVSPEKQERIKRFHSFTDAQNCLLGDVLARSEICRTTGLANKQLKFKINNFGKPLLVNNSHTHFNISHSGHYIACAVSDKSVGIDIELIRPVDIKIAERLFTKDETVYIKDGEREQRFYEVWTKKESHVKWEGKGLYKPLASFSVLGSHVHTNLYYHKIFDNKNTVGHVCTTKKALPSIKMLDITTFVQNIIL